MAVEISRDEDLLIIDPAEALSRLQVFEASLPDDFALAAREAVNNKAQRELRGTTFRSVISGTWQG